MNFSPTADMELLKRKMSAFSSAVLTQSADAPFSKDLWKQCAQEGIQGLHVTSSYGGSQQSLLSVAAAMEGLGYGTNNQGLLFALNAQMWSVQQPISIYGTAAQKEKYLPQLIEGHMIGAHAATEEQSGSDIFSLQAKATRCDGGYLLSGSKRYITLAPVADIILVFARTNDKPGIWGISAFLLDAKQQGITMGESKPKIGLRYVPFSEITFRDCFVSDEQRLGEEGGGGVIFRSSLEYERMMILFPVAGRMKKQLEETIRYANERRQFGHAIGSFQSVSNRIADMKMRLDAAVLLAYQAVWKKESGQSAAMESAMAKLALSEAFVASSMDAFRIQGGAAFLQGSPAATDVQDALGSILFSGTSDIQRNIISKSIGVHGDCYAYRSITVAGNNSSGKYCGLVRGYRDYLLGIR